MKPTRPIVLLAAVAVASHAAADPLRIDAEPAFTGMVADYRTMVVTLDNDGPDARGVLRVLGNGGGTSYPVDLPHGASKRLIVVNDDAGSGFFRLVLDTDRGAATQTVMGGIAENDPGGSAAMIGGYQGDLAFLQKKQEVAGGKATPSTHDFYVAAADAPSRAAAYAPFNAVFLGPEADRIDDATVTALKDYALGGGTLVFLGGARAAALDDTRWADVLPGSDWRPKTVAPDSVLARLGGFDVSQAFTVRTPARVAPGASAIEENGASTFEWQRGLGLGRVVVLGYSPLDAPLSAWSGRTQAFAPLVRGSGSLRARRYVEYYLNEGLNGERTTRYDGSVSPATDPFSAKLPPSGAVFGLLAGYFVLVVPVSFLVLRKLKRGELAWVTAPLLSLGFASALFKSAEGLYAAKLSTASQGVVVLQEGEPRATFYGTSQMFFPHGGDYDLRLRNVDGLTAVRRDDTFGTSALAGFDPVDTGREVVVPKLEANNLAFREMSFSQRIPNADWFRIDPVDATHVRVENRSPYAFTGGVAAGEADSPDFRLAPGRSIEVALVSRGPSKSKKTDLFASDPHNFTNKDGRIALEGRIAGYRPGPQLGEEVRSQSGINVIAFAGEKMP